MGKAEHDKWDGRSRGGSSGYGFFIFMIKHLGLGVSYFFLSLVTVYFIPFAPRATSAAWFYNRRILGRGIVGAVCGVFRQYYLFGQTLIDKIAISGGMKNRFSFEFDEYRQFLALLDSGQGVVLISAHTGNWEIGSVFFGDYGTKMNVVMYDSEYEKIREKLEKQSGGRNFNVIPVNRDRLESVVRIKNALDRAEYVCFQGDRYLSEDNTMAHIFMGREAKFPSGPFLTSARLKVPVAFYYAMRERGRRYRFIFLLAESAPPSAANPKPEERLLEQYIDATERIVKKYPAQWFNFYKFWDY